MSNWKDIKESIPPENYSVLITDGIIVVVAYWEWKYHEVPVWQADAIGGYDVEFDWKDEEIIAWMEIPELPQKFRRNKKS